MRGWRVRFTVLLLAVCLLVSGCWRPHNYIPQVDRTKYTLFSEMVYERPSVAAFDAQLQEIQRRIDEGRSLAYLIYAIDEFLTLYYDFYTNSYLAEIYYWKDLTDTHWEAEYTFCAEMTTQVENLLDEMYRKLAASEYREKLEADSYFGPGFFDYYEGESYWDETYIALAEEEKRLQSGYYDIAEQAQQTEYYSEAYFSQYGPQLLQLYVDLIAVRQKIAAHLGYENYVDFAYENYYYRDYTPEQAEQYFKDIGTQLRDLYCWVNQSDAWSAGSQPCSVEQTFAYVKNAAGEMGGVVAEAFDMMEKAELYDLTYSPNKHDVSCEIYLHSYMQPYIFTNPSLQGSDKLIFAHEFGHFTNDYVCSGSYAGTDVSEIHSGAMEYLSICYTEDAEALEQYKMAESLCLFVEQSAYALFEQQVYRLSAEELTAENVQKLYEQIGADFGFESWGWDSRDLITITHFYHYPMYVASYVVSNDLAFQIYQMEKAQSGAGLEVYLSCLESEDSYLAYFAQTYGLESPFAPQRAESLKQTFTEVFNS